ncbi:hypothetical protein ACYOEI_37605 [Singulisphaera rosea]
MKSTSHVFNPRPFGDEPGEGGAEVAITAAASTLPGLVAISVDEWGTRERPRIPFRRSIIAKAVVRGSTNIEVYLLARCRAESGISPGSRRLRQRLGAWIARSGVII